MNAQAAIDLARSAIRERQEWQERLLNDKLFTDDEQARHYAALGSRSASKGMHRSAAAWYNMAARWAEDKEAAMDWASKAQLCMAATTP